MPEALRTPLYEQFAHIAERISAEPEMPLDRLRHLLEELGTLAAEPTDVTYESVEANGVPGILAKPLGGAEDRAIVYTHGGGVCNSAASHRKLAAHLAKAAGVHAFVVDFRRAPEFTFPVQIDDVLEVHRWLRDQGIAPEHAVAAGDSAGGNLAVTSTLKLRDLGEPMPAAVVVFSPWLDLENTGTTLESNRETDALIDREMSVSMSEFYRGGASMVDPLVTPLYADLTGFPPLYVTAGDVETLQDHATRFVALAEAAGVDITYEEGAGQQHVYQYMAGRDPDADRSIANAGAWLRPRLGLA